MSEYMPESMSEKECQSICQKEHQIECQNISIYAVHTSRWYVGNYAGAICQGGDHSKYSRFFSKEAWVDLCPWTKASEAPFWRWRVRWLTSWFGACSFFHIPTERNDDDDHDDEWMNGCMNEWMDAWMNEWMDEWMNEWKNERMD